jgi:hypothetical protein
VFRATIVVFMSGSIGCALSGSLTQFVLARMLEGMSFSAGRGISAAAL